MVDALIHSREGTIVPEVAPNLYGPVPTTIGDARQMRTWEPWVRAYIAIGEMMRGIDFQISGANAFQIRSFVSGPTSSLIAEIQRPAQTTFEQQIPWS
jgi:hypothetical protein